MKLLGTILFIFSIGIWFIIGFVALVFAIPTACFLFAISSFCHSTTRWAAFRALWIWEAIRTSYFQYKVIGEYKEVEKMMVAVYPHGVIPWAGIFYWGLNPAFPDLTLCIHSFVFLVPGLREIAGWMGCTSVSANDIKTACGKVLLYPGGIDDIAYRGNDVYKRHGFIKLAKEMGATIYPVWLPDERKLCDIYLPFGNFFKPLIGFPFPLFMWPFWPRRTECRIIYGEPFSMENLSVEAGFEKYFGEIARLQKEF